MKDFLTEKEAADRWCPLTRCAGDADNREADGDPLDGALCIGSKCMAWRWSNQDTGPTGDATGFCGAFGSPQLRGR